MKSVCTLSVKYNLDSIRNLITDEANTANKVSGTPFVPLSPQSRCSQAGIVRNSTKVSASAAASNNARLFGASLAMEELVAHLLASSSSPRGRAGARDVGGHQVAFARCTP